MTSSERDNTIGRDDTRLQDLFNKIYAEIYQYEDEDLDYLKLIEKELSEAIAIVRLKINRDLTERK